ncbi:unnamed protein product [Arabis nemorensis]|uniref:Uncharacterized protein n=1 Tax=Arabis nemorensis TaxID=586526 RepID=A0A565B7F1_9BRAS|nr:unnamed protein product [Arabis nemorensis]
MERHIMELFAKAQQNPPATNSVRLREGSSLRLPRIWRETQLMDQARLDTLTSPYPMLSF